MTTARPLLVLVSGGPGSGRAAGALDRYRARFAEDGPRGGEVAWLVARPLADVLVNIAKT